MTETAAREAEAQFERRGPLALITLNRPRVLNALNLRMIRAIAPKLTEWASDPSVQAVAIRGAGDRAFCAGGDVRAVWGAGKDGARDGLPETFFREEYVLNHQIHTFPKPFIALVDGIAMGGGVGLSIHGGWRVLTERASFAMPETGIGFFPDIGGTWFLPRFPGELGTWYALSGAVAEPADALHIGYGTHFAPSSSLENLVTALAEADWSRDPAEVVVNRVLAAFSAPAGAPPIAAARAVIDSCFAHDDVEAIVDALGRTPGAFAVEARDRLAGRSPSSLKMTLEALRRGRALRYPEAVTMEYRLSQAAMRGHDFYEGIRAQLVDKDRAPRWRPARLEDVARDWVEAQFAPLGARDLFV